MAKAGVPESWMTMLGIFKAADALGLPVAIGVPLTGTAAAVARTRLLARPGNRVPSIGRGRAGVAAGLVVRKTI
jgi:hypothetical protein